MRKRRAATRDVHVFAPLGSNPAQLTALTWALSRDHGLRVIGARLVLFARGAHFLEDELLGDAGGLAQLHEVLGPDYLPRDTLQWTVPEHARGVPLEDDGDEQGQRCFGDAALREAWACLRDADDRPVVFALVGGRRRTLTVLATLVAQYLARPGDLVVDLRFEPRDAETPGRFFFPDQRDQRPIASKSGGVRPSQVIVQAVEVQLPRLRAFASTAPARTFGELLRGGQSALDAGAPLQLRVDLRGPRGDLLVEREDGPLTISLSAAERLVLGAMVQSGKRARQAERWFVPLSVKSGELVRLVRRLPWTSDVRMKAIRFIHEGASDSEAEEDAIQSLREARSRLAARLREEATRDGDPRLAALVPERDSKTRRERFRLAAQTELLLPHA